MALKDLKSKILKYNNYKSAIIYGKDNSIIYRDYFYDMNMMFYNCLSLLSITSERKIYNVTDIYRMFYNCESLKSLPDISKWNTNKVNDMSQICYNCRTLASLPDISKWNTDNVNDMWGMFQS